MKKLIWSLFVVSLLMGVLTGSVFAEDSVAVVFGVGGLGDQSYNDMVYSGLMEAAEDFGIEYSYFEPQAIAEFEDVFTRYANTRNYDLIIGIGFEQEEALEMVSSRFPEQRFVMIDGNIESENVASITFNEIERGFMPGLAAALMTTHSVDEKINSEKVIGVVGGVSNPVINANIQGFKAGAKLIDPEIRVLHAFVGSFGDPATGKELTISMFEEEADCVWGPAGRSGLGVISAAEEENQYALGSNVDQSHIAPENILTSALKNVDTAVYSIIEDTINGRFQGGHIILGLEDNGVGYTETLIPEEYINEIEEIKQKVLDGDIDINDYVEEL